MIALRWVCFFPVALLGSIIFGCIAYLAFDGIVLSGEESTHWLATVVSGMISTATLFMIGITIAPSKKEPVKFFFIGVSVLMGAVLFVSNITIDYWESAIAGIIIVISSLSLRTIKSSRLEF